jgi:hypothetical protein
MVLLLSRTMECLNTQVIDQNIPITTKFPMDTTDLVLKQVAIEITPTASKNRTGKVDQQ